MDGFGYWGKMDQRIQMSDVVIYLDVLVKIYKRQAEQRIQNEKHMSNPQVISGRIYSEAQEKQTAVIKQFER